LNKKYKDYQAPFYSLKDEVPILLTIILGLQHGLTMIGSIVSPPLAIAGEAFNFGASITQYLVSAAFITIGLATFLQVTRVHLKETPFYIGTGLPSVVEPTFDILPIAFNYTDMRYANGASPVAAYGTKLPCPDAWGAILGSMMCCVWIQICMSMVPPKTLNKIFPKTITGSMLLLVGVYLISNGMQNWAGAQTAMEEQSFMHYAQILTHLSLYPG
jgi:xanthine/uracil permease